MQDKHPAPTRLVLWDVDHTLIATGGVGRVAFAEAFHAATGLPLREMADPSGLTEGEIFRRTATAHGIAEPDALFNGFAYELARAYESRTDLLTSKGRALPGARLVLQNLAERSDLLQGVLTGNLSGVARVKLAAFGLNGFVNWDVSAFAEDGAERAELVHAARARARTVAGHSFDGNRTILFGDTVNDVQTAVRTGATVIAVATGTFKDAQLRAAGARTVLASLEDPGLGAVLEEHLPQI
jgi:phosphoglycolate phosphatase-like HAD superfamily hydrolase